MFKHIADKNGAYMQYGGIDRYVLKTKSDLLGWEGMRIRVMVRERLEAQGRDVRLILSQHDGTPLRTRTLDQE